MASQNWYKTLFCYIWVFNVGRGLCAFIRTPLNQGILVDCGSSDDFSPLIFIRKNIIPKLDKYKGNKLAQVIISHPHSDHFSDINNLFFEGSDLGPTLLTCPHDKSEDEAINWDRVENPESSSTLVEKYRESYKQRALPLQTILFESNRTVPNLEYGIFYLRPPICEKVHEEDNLKYTNSTSILLYLRYGFQNILFTGDMTPEVMKNILEEKEGVEKRYTIFEREQSENSDWHCKTSTQPSLTYLLKSHGLTVLVAPHHGLKSGFPADLYTTLKNNKPNLVVISEKRHFRPQDGDIESIYQSKDGASGMDVEIEGIKGNKYSLSTKSGHHILLVFTGSGNCRVYAEKDPLRLLEK
jgi:hypothetical protein